MNDTEQLFWMAVIWALIAAAIARFIPNWPGRIAFFSIAVALPFWELPYGYYNFQQLCREQAKLQVFEKISPQDSVCIDYFDLGLYTLLNRAGFKRVEITGRSDNAKDYAATGRVFFTGSGQAQSAYCISFKSNIFLPWGVWRADTLIVRADGGNAVARQSRFRWDGMWWQQQARPVLGIGGMCSSDLNAPISVLRHGGG